MINLVLMMMMLLSFYDQRCRTLQLHGQSSVVAVARAASLCRSKSVLAVLLYCCIASRVQNCFIERGKGIIWTAALTMTTFRLISVVHWCLLELPASAELVEQQCHPNARRDDYHAASWRRKQRLGVQSNAWKQSPLCRAALSLHWYRNLRAKQS